MFILIKYHKLRRREHKNTNIYFENENLEVCYAIPETAFPTSKRLLYGLIRARRGRQIKTNYNNPRQATGDGVASQADRGRKLGSIEPSLANDR